jgi:hypothetical protein
MILKYIAKQSKENIHRDGNAHLSIGVASYKPEKFSHGELLKLYIISIVDSVVDSFKSLFGSK